MKETVLWATPIGAPDNEEKLILDATIDDQRLADAKAWALVHGFDRLREQVIDTSAFPDFVGAINFQRLDDILAAGRKRVNK